MRIGILLIATLLGGCATNGFKQFYHELPLAQDTLTNRVQPAPANPQLDRISGDFRSYEPQYSRAGYVVIGYSSFNGPKGTEAEALAQGKAVGADVVVTMSPRHTETVSSSIPITTPTSETSHTNSNATVYGTGGSANVYGNSTTTTYSSQTTYVPISTHRYDFGAIYLVKRKYIFGASFDGLKDAERAAIQSNKGVKIVNVVDGSPAFEADVLVGDIILTANGKSVANRDVFANIITESTGKTIELEIFRNGQRITKSVPLK